MTNILVVDDNQQNLYMLQVLLSTNGYKVEQASNGVQALERAHGVPPDLVISDILMPVMDGFALCRAWKKDERLKTVPFIFYTATYTDPRDEEFALSLGAERFIVKPMEPEKFLATLREILKDFKAGKLVAAHQPVGEAEFYKEYNATLVRKLEDKVLQLQEKNRALEDEITERKQTEAKVSQQTEELGRRNEELARLYRASGSLLAGASLSLEQLARMVVEVVQKEFSQANCSLIIAQKESNELVHFAIAGPFASQVTPKRLTLDGTGLIPQVFRTGASVNEGNVRSNTNYLPAWEAAQSELGIPLKVGNDVIGVIDVQSASPNAFDQDDERLLSIFGEQAALAIEHSRLNAQTDAHMQQLLALRTVDMAISSSFDVTLTLGILLDQVTRLLGIHAVDILIFNATSQTFKFACERGFRTHALQHTQIKFGTGYAWRVVRERKMIVIPAVRADADGLLRTPDISDEQFVSYIGIPLLAKGQVKGVLEVFHREALVLEREWNAFLEMLAGQAAIAIDNSELFDHLQSSNADLSLAYDSTLEGWASALELRDKETEGHTRRVAELATRLAQTLGVRENELLQIYRGALLHDIGKMGVADNIVLKPGPLSEDEWVIMRKHPQDAYDMLSQIGYLRQALDIPYCHHEKWDGTGYPRGLKGNQIPLAARLFAVVDVWDALTSDRPYRKAWKDEKAREYIQEQAGLYFDPEVVKAFLDPSFKRE